MYCTTCGNMLVDDGKVCKVCGAVLGEKAPEIQTSNNSSESQWPWTEENNANQPENYDSRGNNIPNEPDTQNTSGRMFDFNWNNDAFPSEEKVKSEDIDFDWGEFDPNSDFARSHIKEVGKAAKERDAQENAERRITESEIVINDDTSALDNNSVQDPQLYENQKNEEFQELLDEHVEKMQGSQPELDESKNQVLDDIMNAPVETPETIVKEPAQSLNVDDRIASFLEKADRELLEEMNKRIQEQIGEEPTYQAEPSIVSDVAPFASSPLTPEENLDNARVQHDDLSAMQNPTQNAGVVIAEAPSSVFPDNQASFQTTDNNDGAISIGDIISEDNDSLEPDEQGAFVFGSFEAKPPVSTQETTPPTEVESFVPETVAPATTAAFETIAPETVAPATTAAFETIAPEEVAPITTDVFEMTLPNASSVNAPLPVTQEPIPVTQEPIPTMDSGVQKEQESIIATPLDDFNVIMGDVASPFSTQTPEATTYEVAPSQDISTIDSLIPNSTLSKEETSSFGTEPQKQQDSTSDNNFALFIPGIASPFGEGSSPGNKDDKNSMNLEFVLPDENALAKKVSESYKSSNDDVNSIGTYPNLTPEDTLVEDDVLDLLMSDNLESPPEEITPLDLSLQDVSEDEILEDSQTTPPDIINEPVVFPFDLEGDEKTEEKTPKGKKKEKKAKEGKEKSPKPEKSGKMPKALIIIIDIIVIIAVLCLCAFAIMKFAPETGAADFINRAMNKVVGVFNGGSQDKVATKDNAATSKDTVIPPIEDKETLVSSQAFNNENIGNVVYAPDAAFEEGKKYQLAGASASTPIENNYWTEGASGQILYDEAAVATIIRFNSNLVKYINEQNLAIYDDIEVGSEADPKLAEYVASVDAIKFNAIGIGDIRTDGDYYYVWTVETISETVNDKTKKKTYNKLYMLVPDVETMKVSDIEELS